MPNDGMVFVNGAGEEKYFFQDQFADAEAQGYKPIPGQDVAVQSDVGGLEVYSNPEDAIAVSEESTRRLASDAETEKAWRERRLQEDFGGIGGKAATFGISAAEGATLGGSSALARMFGANMENIRKLKEANPGTALAGELTGAIAPGLFTGGGSTAAKAALVAAEEGAALTRAAGTVAREAGVIGKTLRMLPSGQVAKLGAGISRSGTAASKVLAAGVESTLFGAGDALNEVMLSDDPVTVERLASTISSRAAFTGLAGAGVGVFATAGEKALGRARKVMARRFAGEAEEGAGTVAEQLADLRKTTDEANPWATVELASPTGGKKAKYAQKQAQREIDKTYGHAEEAAKANRRAGLEAADKEVRLSKEAVEDAKLKHTRLVQEAKEANAARAEASSRLQGAKKRGAKPGQIRKYEQELAAKEEALAKARKAQTEAATAAAEKKSAHAKLLASQKSGKKEIEKLYTSEIAAAKGARRTAQEELGAKGTAGPWAKMDDALEVHDINVRLSKTQEQFQELLGNVKGIERNPARALEQVERQGQALRDLQARSDVLRKRLEDMGQGAGSRAKSLDRVPELIEKNAALESRLRAMVDTGAKGPGMGEQIVQGAAFTGVMGAAQEVGVPMPVALVGAGVLSRKAGALLFGRLGKAGTVAASRMATALDALMGVGEAKLAKVAPVATSKILARAVFADDEDAPKDQGKRRESHGDALVREYRNREREIRSQVEAGPNGLQLSANARLRLGEKLAPIRFFSPGLGDGMEETFARRMAHLASTLPKRPNLAGMSLGPDTWRPPDHEIRRFARVVRAVEDPAGIVERAANLTATPEDGAALREVYPALAQEILERIVDNAANRKKRISSKRRFMLSMITGTPMDPAMDPRILGRLQAMYAEEPGGGFEPPKAQPQFGSIKKPDPTPAQERSVGNV